MWQSCHVKGKYKVGFSWELKHPGQIESAKKIFSVVIVDEEFFLQRTISKELALGIKPLIKLIKN